MYAARGVDKVLKHWTQAQTPATVGGGLLAACKAFRNSVPGAGDMLKHHPDSRLISLPRESAALVGMAPTDARCQSPAVRI